MRVLISGASGLVGSATSAALSAAGHEVVPLVRSERPGSGSVSWDPDGGVIDAAQLEGFDAVIHLAGENIAKKKWTPDQKRRIHASRVGGTELLCTALARCERPPGVFVGASAIGYYGDRGADVMTEESPPGDDFLADTCTAWEAAAAPLASRSRVVQLRIGVVLSTEGGALAKMLTPFRMGLGGVVGPGDQYVSWIELSDLVAILSKALEDDRMAGVYNAVAPTPVTQREFTKTLGRVLGRPTIFPLPSFAVKLLFGEMGTTLLLASTRVEPRRLQDLGFSFANLDIEDGIRAALASG